MSELTDDFQTLIDGIEAAASNALDTVMYDGLLEELNKAAIQRVYSYPNKSEYFAAKRRYTIADRDNMLRRGSGLTMIVENKAITQSGEAGEVNWVEEGLHQDGAGARPFMELGLENYVWGRASEDLVFALQQAGYDAHVG